MFDNVTIAFGAVAPMFINIAIGYLLSLKKIIDMACVKKVNKMLFNVCFPMLVLNNLYGSSIHEAYNGKLIGFTIIISFLLWVITIPIVMKIEKRNTTRGAMIQGINRSNFLVIGFPIINRVCVGESISSTTPIALLMMGATIDFKEMKEAQKNIILSVLGKLIVVPGIASITGAILGFRGASFVILLAFFSASTTVTSYTMAEQMKSDEKLARDNLVVSTALVPFTMFGWIFLYKSIGMF